jgi:hypothetical protein
MQTTIYYRDEDQYLMDKLEQKSSRERKSKSAIILSILEEYFESNRKVGGVLQDLGALDGKQLKSALEDQSDGKDKKLIGEILLEKGYVEEVDLDRALTIQNRAG